MKTLNTIIILISTIEKSFIKIYSAKFFYSDTSYSYAIFWILQSDNLYPNEKLNLDYVYYK